MNDTSAAAKAKGKEFVEQIEVAGDQLVATVKKLVSDGSARRIVLRGEDGKEMLSLPLNLGVAGAGVLTLASPLLAAVGAIAALVTKVRVDIVRDGDDDPAAEGDVPTDPQDNA